MLRHQSSQSMFRLSCGRIYCDFTSITVKMEKEEQGDAAATWGKFAVVEIYSKATGVIVGLSCVKTVT